MDYESKLSAANLRELKDKFSELAEAGSGHMDYSEIRDELMMLKAEVNTRQIQNLALDIMKEYTHRPALIWELDKVLTKKQRAEFTEWRNTHKIKRAKVKCPNCGHKSIVRIVYGMPIDESTFNAADNDQVILGGCIPTDNKYGCTNCDAEFPNKP